MRKKRNNYGFSLTEVLLAVGTLSIGMIFVAGVFPVAIHFSTIATERTIAAVVADEAFAKIRLYGLVDFSLSPPWPVDPTAACVDFNDVSSVRVNPGEFAYPSTYRDITEKHYFWSALCRRVEDTRLVQVTVFVSRRTGSGMRYRAPDNPISGRVPYPMPVQVGVSLVSGAGNENRLTIDAAAEEPLINDGYTIVDNETGRLYRVLERDAGRPDTIVLDRPWDVDSPAPDMVWVVPPPAGGGRYPCIAVYQKVIRF